MSAGPIRAHGKCILAGEHAVVRGGDALVFPLHSRALTLAWHPSEDGNMHFDAGVFAAPLREALALALERSGYRLPAGYQLRVTSDIPIRAGLGSSAALSVAVVRFLQAAGAALADPFALALEIENIFHGRSSGLDVACVLASAPIRYRRGAAPRSLEMAWRPPLYLFDTGIRSSTKDCVARVEAAGRPDLDERMSLAVRLAEDSLASGDANAARELARAMELASSCFEEWGLGADEKLSHRLKCEGALAVKPTGSGGGGFLLCLWPGAAPNDLGLIPVWAGS